MRLIVGSVAGWQVPAPTLLQRGLRGLHRRMDTGGASAATSRCGGHSSRVHRPYTVQCGQY